MSTATVLSEDLDIEAMTQKEWEALQLAVEARFAELRPMLSILEFRDVIAGEITMLQNALKKLIPVLPENTDASPAPAT